MIRRRAGDREARGGLCFFHANPNKAVELGRIGGKKNGQIQVAWIRCPTWTTPWLSETPSPD
jgi:hypothetical protein